MTVLVMGAGGQLGRELCKLIPDSICYGHNSSNFAYSLDLTSHDDVEREISYHRPDVLINASAMTNVDLCETDKRLAMEINGKALKHIAHIANKIGAYLVHISTDYVFDGTEGNYDEHSTPNPVNYYGLSKLVGDIYANSYENSLIIRTSGVFGYSNNFPRFAYNSLKNGETLNVIEGHYSPIHAHYLGEAIKELLVNKPKGKLNIAGDKTSRLELAHSISDLFGFDPNLIHAIDAPLNFKARRPFDSSLDITQAKSLIAFDFHSTEKNLKLLGNV